MISLKASQLNTGNRSSAINSDFSRIIKTSCGKLTSSRQKVFQNLAEQNHNLNPHFSEHKTSVKLLAEEKSRPLSCEYLKIPQLQMQLSCLK